jgi:hypothetical protein
MANTLRVTISLLLLCLIVIGVVFYYLPLSKYVNATVSQSTLQCGNVIDQQLGSSQSLSYSCPVAKNYWVDISLAASTPVTVTAYYNDTALKMLTVTYSQTGTRFSANLPLFTTGSLFVAISNSLTNTSTLSGSINYYASEHVKVQYSAPAFPLRIAGVAVAGASAFLLFIILWNPYQIGSRIFFKIQKQ